MKRWQAGLAAALAIGGASSAFAADLPYERSYGERVLRSRTIVTEERALVRPVNFRLDVRTTPWLHYEMRPSLICRLAWERGRRGDRPVEVCRSW
ncbi:hypothetical protein [Hansschlegelia beijingensis]|uniref:Uncharacterized protein n=1 Tax=Hansschlegelia beijingensis TaxID=1133344 RepID=A0A7W6GHK6_9HYPH|nr:hypothetical protein [Hansschlegelia beijingensis]MBB3973879.1 hypothetical protein [Hansschlegelia beijingensis]